MKTARYNALARLSVKFFVEYLPRHGMTTHTIDSYRDSLELLLRFITARRRSRPEVINLEHFTATTVETFLTYLERTRGNGISTCNTRLAALRTFARFAAREAPEHAVELQRVIAIPFKRGGQRVPLKYLRLR